MRRHHPQAPIRTRPGACGTRRTRFLQHQVQPAAPGGAADGNIASRLRHAGLQDITSGVLADHTDDDFWQSFTLAVGSAGHYLRTLPSRQQAAFGC
jgi:hypothetical protein